MSSNFSPNSFDYSECFFVEKRKSKVGLKKQLHHRRAIVNTNDHMSAFLFALLKKTVKSSKISLFPLIHISMIVWKSLAHELNKNSICIFGIPSNEYLTAVSSHITAEHDAYINFLIRIKFSLYASEQIIFFTIYRVGYGFFLYNKLWAEGANVPNESVPKTRLFCGVPYWCHIFGWLLQSE